MSVEGEGLGVCVCVCVGEYADMVCVPLSLCLPAMFV